ncbi:transmembrane protein, putative (macronuclear) [Tetrahymena thermophila SB210]|uniref:Transmembrane protein, putative n=1 Tax=Tetrahymena thermophila (strain SB210) TaxID=312017 RepID=W7X3Z9_TETTS|nr:transmembrane protein, putative [Tetrahymena thermophila SB210]EWS72162.1 transmembrane protein, putative [Tetrahymena thermophila SB210]|eukprot:XP_012655293.1 transmembrane protein, putative [Tetrahymena thermophila SB210]
MASQVANKFKYLDIFGQKVILNFHENSLIQTVFGGITASLVCAVAIIFCYNSTNDVLNKVNFTVQGNKIFSDNPSQLNLTSDKFMIAVNMIQDNFIQNPYLNITLQQRVYTLLPNGTQLKQNIDIQLEQCTFKHWDALNKPGDIIITKDQYNSYNISNYLCPKLGTNLTIQGQIANQVYQFIKFTVTGCQNQTNPQSSPNLWKPVCPSVQAQQKYYNQNTIRIQFLFSNYIINPTQVGQFTTRYVANDVFFQIQPGYMYTTADIYMTETIISEDKSLYPWKDISNQSLAAQLYGDYRQQYTFGNNTIYGAFFFDRSRFKQVYSISYEKFDNLIAQIGGFVQSLVLVASLFVGLYNKMHYTIELANEIYDFDLNYNEKKDKYKSKIEQQQTNKSDIKNEGSKYEIGQQEQNKMYKLVKMYTKKFNEERQANHRNSFESPRLDVTQSPNIHFNSRDIEKDSINEKDINIQMNDLQLIDNDKLQQGTHEKSNKEDHLETNQISDMQKNLRFDKKEVAENNSNQKIQKFVFLNLKDNLNDKSNQTKLKSGDEKNNNLFFNNIIENQNLKNVSQSPFKQDKKLDFDDLNVFKKENFQQSLFEKSKSIKPLKTYFTQRSKAQTKDILKYSTANPHSISQIDKHFQSQINNQANEMQAVDKQNSHEDLKETNFGPLTPMNFSSNPRLLSIGDRLQNDKADIFFLDSQIEPESDLEISDSPQRNRKQKNPIFHTIQPISHSMVRDNKFQGKKTRSFSQIIFQKDNTIKKQDSFSSLRIQEQPNNNIKSIKEQKFFDAYKEEMRKDYMTKQLQKVLSKRQKLHLSVKYFIYKLSCGKFYNTKENMLIDKANVFLQKDIDIIVILNKIKELEKLKCLLLDQSQLALFNYFPKPLLQIDQNQNIVKKDQMIKVVKQLEKKMKTLDIKPQYLSTVKKAKDKFKNLLKKKQKKQEFFKQTDLLINLEQHHYRDYQRLYKAYEEIINKKECSRMDNILINNLGEETKKIFQNSINMKFGMEKLHALITRQYDKSPKCDQIQQKNNN